MLWHTSAHSLVGFQYMLHTSTWYLPQRMIMSSCSNSLLIYCCTVLLCYYNSEMHYIYHVRCCDVIADPRRSAFEEFQQHGGAQIIMQPVLLHPVSWCWLLVDHARSCQTVWAGPEANIQQHGYEPRCEWHQSSATPKLWERQFVDKSIAAFRVHLCDRCCCGVYIGRLQWKSWSRSDSSTTNYRTHTHGCHWSSFCLGSSSRSICNICSPHPKNITPSQYPRNVLDISCLCPTRSAFPTQSHGYCVEITYIILIGHWPWRSETTY